MAGGWCWFGSWLAGAGLVWEKNTVGKLQQNRVKVDLVPLINNTSINNQSSEHVFEFWRPENIERGGDTYTAALPLLRCTMENGGCARLARIESCSAITTTNNKSVRCQLITLPCFSQFDFYFLKKIQVVLDVRLHDRQAYTPVNSRHANEVERLYQNCCRSSF